MQFFIDSQGTTHNVISDPVYQGSTNANELVLVAPLSSANQVTATFRLPTGIFTEPYLMNVQAGTMNINGQIYRIWRCLLDGTVTEYAGQVSVQFEVYQGNGIRLNSYRSAFTVGVGNTETLPDPKDADFYAQILNYLAMLNPQYNVKSVVYSAPEEYIIDLTGSTLETVPKEWIIDDKPEPLPQKFDVDFSPGNIQPAPNSSKAPIFSCAIDTEQDTGFIISFAEAQSVGKLQMNIYGAFYKTNLAIYAEIGGAYKEIQNFDVLNASYDYVSVVINVGEENVTAIKILQPYESNMAIDEADSSILNKGFTNGRFYIESVQMWRPNTEGLITVIASTGRTITFPDASDEYVKLSQKAQAEAEQSASEAKQSAIEAEQSATDAESALTEINNKAGKAGGYPILTDIDGDPKIPSVYIQQVDIKDYIEITDESELATIDAQVGDVAMLVSEVDGEKTITKSWILLSVAENVRNWAVYGTSYATNAGNATFAQTAGNAQKINGLAINGVFTEAQYSALADKTGIYFVTIEGESE